MWESIRFASFDRNLNRKGDEVFCRTGVNLTGIDERREERGGGEAG